MDPVTVIAFTLCALFALGWYCTHARSAAHRYSSRVAQQELRLTRVQMYGLRQQLHDLPAAQQADEDALWERAGSNDPVAKQELERRMFNALSADMREDGDFGGEWLA